MGQASVRFRNRLRCRPVVDLYGIYALREGNALLLPGETNLFEHLWQTICKCCHKGNMINFHHNFQKHNQNNVFIHINICNITVEKGISKILPKFWRKTFTKHLLGQGFYFMLGNANLSWSSLGGLKVGAGRCRGLCRGVCMSGKRPFATGRN